MSPAPALKRPAVNFLSLDDINETLVIGPRRLSWTALELLKIGPLASAVVTFIGFDNSSARTGADVNTTAAISPVQSSFTSTPQLFRSRGGRASNCRATKCHPAPSSIPIGKCHSHRARSQGTAQPILRIVESAVAGGRQQQRIGVQQVVHKQ